MDSEGTRITPNGPATFRIVSSIDGLYILPSHFLYPLLTIIPRNKPATLLKTLMDPLFAKANIADGRKIFKIICGENDENSSVTFIENICKLRKLAFVDALKKVNIPTTANNGITVPSTFLSSESIASHLELLRNRTELQVQTLLNESIQATEFKYAIDTSTTSGCLPLWKLPALLADETAMVFNRATPNVTSPINPMFIEINDLKTDKDGIQVLHQAIQRVLSASMMNETLRQSVCFATNGSNEHIWMVILRRAFDSSRRLAEELEVVRLDSFQTMISLWDHINYISYLSPFYYMMADWFPIRESLKALKVHAGYCAIRLLPTEKHGSARVYSINVPTLDFTACIFN